MRSPSTNLDSKTPSGVFDLSVRVVAEKKGRTKVLRELPSGTIWNRTKTCWFCGGLMVP